RENLRRAVEKLAMVGEVGGVELAGARLNAEPQPQIGRRAREILQILPSQYRIASAAGQPRREPSGDRRTGAEQQHVSVLRMHVAHAIVPRRPNRRDNDEANRSSGSNRSRTRRNRSASGYIRSNADRL